LSSYLRIAPESKLVSASKRGGLNHLCFTADNLEQTIVQLEESGMSVISEPKPGRAFGGRRICWLVGEDPRLNSWRNSLMMTYAFRWRQSITQANFLRQLRWLDIGWMGRAAQYRRDCPSSSLPPDKLLEQHNISQIFIKRAARERRS
jgi:hypothetical protein